MSTIPEVVVPAGDDVLALVQIGEDRERLLADGDAVEDRDLQRQLFLEEGAVRARAGVVLAGEHGLLAEASLDEDAIGVALENLVAEGHLRNAHAELGLHVAVPGNDADGLHVARNRSRSRRGTAGGRGIDLHHHARVFHRHVLGLQARATKAEKSPLVVVPSALAMMSLGPTPGAPVLGEALLLKLCHTSCGCKKPESLKPLNQASFSSASRLRFSSAARRASRALIRSLLPSSLTGATAMGDGVAPGGVYGISCVPEVDVGDEGGADQGGGGGGGVWGAGC